jgi:hypothetical protein
VELEHIITKNDILTIDQEVIMFVFDHYSLKTPKGLNNKFVYLCMCLFFIQVSQKMYQVDDCDFAIHVDAFGKFLRYISSPSKNWKMDVNWCGVEN